MSSLRLHWPFTLLAAIAVLTITGFYPSSSSLPTNTIGDKKLKSLMVTYEKGYSTLNISTTVLSYEHNLGSIGSIESLNSQQAFFDNIIAKLKEIKSYELSSAFQLEHAIIDYETNINLNRIALSKAFIANNNSITDKGLYHQHDGPKWYTYFTQKWSSDNMSPEQIQQYGRQEVKRILGEIQAVKKKAGAPNFNAYISTPEFMTHDTKKIISNLLSTKEEVDKRLSESFPDFPDLPDITISQGKNPELAQVPGYYSSNTFYFNLFDKPFDLKTCDWLFIHEGNPGHHFQLNYEQEIKVPSYRNQIGYSGFREGWAAYIEDLGNEVGLYKTPYNYYSKLEWDLIRSTRLILDVGINYYGWTDQEALQEWKKHIKDLDKIGEREISRMRRWPAQVLTYKLGSKAIKDWRQRMKAQQGDSFSLKAFHTQLLSQRSIPVALIGKLFGGLQNVN